MGKRVIKQTMILTVESRGRVYRHLLCLSDSLLLEQKYLTFDAMIHSTAVHLQCSTWKDLVFNEPAFKTELNALPTFADSESVSVRGSSASTHQGLSNPGTLYMSLSLD